jgi:hypothetical protein
MSERVPDLSVIVTVVDGDPALSRCIEALLTQANPPALEILVPYDDTIAEVGRLADRFPRVRFLDLGSLREDGARLNAFTRHRLYDIRRSKGLRAATGRLLAIVEDRGWPRADWARAMVDLHDSSTYAAVGGVIENGGRGPLRWAVFFCDFGRFQAPIFIDDPEYITDTNICYTREALAGVAELWKERYQEPTVNWALRRKGLKLHLSERPVVVQERGALDLLSVVKERVHWARLFGQIRGREASPVTCMTWAAATPILPFLLFARHFRRELRRRRNVREFVYSSPLTALLLAFWALGEFIGYFEAARMPRRDAVPQ